MTSHESHLIRKWTLTLTCAPWARSADAVTVEALTAGAVPSTLIVDACTSATGWTGSTGDAVTVETITGEVGVQASDANGDGLVSLHRVAAIDMTAHQFLLLDWSLFPGSAVTVQDGSAVVPEIARHLTTGGWYQSWFGPVDPSAFSTGFRVSHFGGPSPELESIAVWRVQKSNMPPGTTPRQLSRIIEVGGTERTPASVHVTAENGTDPLGGLVIVHTSPKDGSGYSPPLRRWRTSASTGPETGDAATYSGKYEPVGFTSGGFYAEVPTSALPEGGYTLVARLRCASASAATIYWSTSTIFPDSTTQQGYANAVVPVTFPDGDYHLVPLGVVTLPSVRTSAGKVQIVIQASDDNPQIYLDEAWLFREDDDCALSIVDTARSNLWLDSPGVSDSVETVWVGDDSQTRVHPGEGLIAQGRHVLRPPSAHRRRWPNPATTAATGSQG